MYYNELLYVLKEYERIITKIKPICKNLLTPHINDMELKLHPGMSTLTWTSMNIDSYLNHVHQGLNKLEQLMLYYVLPALGVLLLFTSLRAWHRQHKRESQ